MFNLIERAFWTAVQTALAIVTVDGLVGLDAGAAELLLTAGIAAVLSALKTLAVERLAVLQKGLADQGFSE